MQGQILLGHLPHIHALIRFMVQTYVRVFYVVFLLSNVAYASESDEIAREAPSELQLPADENGDSCNLEIIGGTSRESFNAFDQTFRKATQSNDVNTLSTLMKYPLSVYRDWRKYTIHSRKEFIQQSQDIFIPKLRQAIADTKNLSCDSQWLFYGLYDGNLRVFIEAAVDGEHYFIHHIELGIVHPDRLPSLKAPETLFTCMTPTHHIIVESIGEKMRYRSWLRKQKMSEKPSMSLIGADVDAEGTGPCRIWIYTFHHKNKSYHVRTSLGCTEGSEDPHTIGSIQIMKKDEIEAEWLCKDK